MSQITEEQKRIIEFDKGYCVVLASPGSGKTFALEKRIGHLIKKGVDGHNILCISFTNKAVHEMRERVEKAIGENHVTITTFHALAYKAIIQFGEKIGFKSFSIIDQGELKYRSIGIYGKMVGEHLEKSDIKEVDNFIRRLSDMKKNMQTPYDVFSKNEGNWIELAKELDKDLYDDKVLTFDDLLYKSVNFFKKHPEELAIFNSQFHYIMQDEAQDANAAQMQFLELLNTKGNVMLIGDIHQSLFSFQGGDVSNVMDFKDNHSATILNLSYNFRSTPEIVDTYNRVLDFSIYLDEFKFKVKAKKPSIGIKPKFIFSSDETHQAELVFNRIMNLKEKGYEYKDFTILYRNNAMSAPYESIFLKNGVPYVTRSGSFLERREVKMMMSCIKMADDVYKKDELYCLNNICSPIKNQVSEGTIGLVYSLALQANKSFVDFVMEEQTIKGVGKVRKQGLMDFTHRLGIINDTLKRIRHVDKSNESSYDLGTIMNQLEYILADDSNDKVPLQERVEGMQSFNMLWKSYVKKAEKPSVSDFLNTLFISNPEDKNEDGGVILSTIHSYKGGENKVVFLINVKDGMFVRNPSDHDAYMDELNVFYVGLSRAKERMFVCSMQYSFSYFYQEHTYSLMQMFIGEDYIEGVDLYEEVLSKPTQFYIPYNKRHSHKQ